MQATVDPLWSHAQARPMTPLLLAVWQDNHLSPAELLAIRDALERAPLLNPAARAQVAAWLDPEHPPTPHALRHLERHVRGFLRELPARERHGLLSVAAALGQGHLPQPLAQGLLASLSLGAGWFDRKLSQPQLPASAPVPSYRGDPGQGSTGSERVVESGRLRRLLDGPTAPSRDLVRSLLAQDTELRPLLYRRTEDYREQVRVWLLRLLDAGLLEHCYPMGYSAGRDLQRFAAVFETLAMFDLSLVVKFGVQAGLFAGAIETLGTDKHQRLLEAALTGETLGCFAMTERGHGSNVRDLQTRASFDAASQEFVIHSPGLSSGKEWIGNAALHGRVAVVFAQLQVREESFGVHAFVVPIRNVAGEPEAGVRIEDCGEKMGLNGVDNGRLYFERVRVPRAALLDRFGHVDESGDYHSPIPSPGKRFFTMVSTLVGGRIAVAGAGNTAAKVGLAIALRYAEQRTQFPDDAGHEQPILRHESHRRRLLPPLAACYAFTFAQQALVRAANPEDENLIPSDEAGLEIGHDVDTLAAGIKALATWHAIETLQQCRECCGGQGYLTSNRIDTLRTDTDVFTTFEGDNTVLLSLVASNLMRFSLRDLSKQPLRSLARIAAQAVGRNLPARMPGSTQPRVSELTQPQSLLELMQQREQHLRLSLMGRVFVRTQRGLGPKDAFEECQQNALELARAYTEAFVMACFVRATASEPGLQDLCLLHGISCVQRDLAFYLGEGFLPPRAVAELRRNEQWLLESIAPHAGALVEAFGIPDTCLGPLADLNYLQASGLATGKGESDQSLQAAQ